MMPMLEHYQEVFRPVLNGRPTDQNREEFRHQLAQIYPFLT